MVLTNFAIASFALMAALPYASGCKGTAKYQVTFQGTWTPERHHSSANSLPFPEGGGFSPIAVTTHSDKYSMFKVRGIASRGVQMIAETGNPMLLGQEVMHNCRSACGPYSATPCNGGAGGGQCTASMEIEVSEHKHYVSILTMVAPSPDFICGVSAKTLCVDEKWSDGFKEFLMPLDAGTDSTTAFSFDPNELTMPVEQITTLFGRTSPFYNDELKRVPPVAVVTVTRME